MNVNGAREEIRAFIARALKIALRPQPLAIARAKITQLRRGTIFHRAVPALTQTHPLHLHPTCAQPMEPSGSCPSPARVTVGASDGSTQIPEFQASISSSSEKHYFLNYTPMGFAVTAWKLNRRGSFPALPLQQHRHLCLISVLPSCSTSSSPKFNRSHSQAAVSLRYSGAYHRSSPN